MASASVFNASESSLVAWTSDISNSSTQTNTIPNFFSKSKFGNTKQIREASQFFVVVAIVSVVLRAFSRRRTKTPWKLDDWCAVAATVFLVANQAIFTAIDYLGVKSFSFLGKLSDKQEKARIEQIVAGLKLGLAFEVMYLIGIFLVKFSMLFLYQRFAKQTKGITLYLRITQGICVITFAVCIFSLFLSCIPINMFWSLHGTNIQCSRRTLLTYTSGISNILTNTLVLAVPVPLLLRATLSKRQRIGVLILYIFGAFVIVASALHFTTQLLAVSVPQSIGWSQMEISLAIILASAPMSVKLLLLPLIQTKEERERILRVWGSRNGLGEGGLGGGKGGGGGGSGGSQGRGSGKWGKGGAEEREQTSDVMRKIMSQHALSPDTASRPPTGHSSLPPYTSRQGKTVSFAAYASDDERARAEALPPKRIGPSTTLSVRTGLRRDDEAADAREREEEEEEGEDAIRMVKDVPSPDYQKLRLVRREDKNGQSVWEVRPISEDLGVAGETDAGRVV